LVRLISQLRTSFGTPFLTETLVRPLISSRLEPQTHYKSLLTESFSSSCSFFPRKLGCVNCFSSNIAIATTFLDPFYLRFCLRNRIPFSKTFFLLFFVSMHERGWCGKGRGGCSMYLNEYSLDSKQTFMGCRAFKKLFTLMIIHVDHDVIELQNDVTDFKLPHLGSVSLDFKHLKGTK